MREKNNWIFALTSVFLLVIFAVATFFIPKKTNLITINNTTNTITLSSPTPTSTPTPSPLPALPTAHIIPQKLHVYQTFNNCGPASLSMLLSYFGINKSQLELGERLRPYQNPQGDNDDKSVTFEELAVLGNEYDLVSFHRPNGNIELLKQFIASNIPVATRTLLHINEDIGHYRTIRGYDDEKKIIIQDDSLQGNNLSYSYQDFDELWKKFNYEYLVLVPLDKKLLAERILGADLDEKKAWETAVSNAQKELEKNPVDIYSHFNLSVALYHTDDYNQSVSEFELIENQLPFRTLWYQIEPVKAYFALNNYERVFAITDSILNNHNRAFSELYILRGKIYQKQGNIPAARVEFEKAVMYNTNLQEARVALDSIQ